MNQQPGRDYTGARNCNGDIKLKSFSCIPHVSCGVVLALVIV